MKRVLSQQAYPAELSDSELARRIAEGDNGAFEVLMRHHNRVLFRTARAILRDDAEAEDTLQDGYLQAYRTISSFRGEARLSTWLGRIVANEALMRLRKRTRRDAIVPLHPTATVEDLSQTSEANMAEGPEASAQRAQIRRLIEAQIDTLPEAYRAVFVLRAIEELSVEETAEILQIPAATVRTRFFRARSLMREALAREVDTAYEDAFAFAGERCDRIVAGVFERIARATGETR